MAWVRERWNSFWFEPSSPANLGFCRAVFYGALFFYFLPQDFSSWAEVSPAFWYPLWLFDGRLSLPGLAATYPALSGNLLTAMQVGWKLALGLSCLGLLTRLSTAGAFVLGLYLLGLPASYGHASHQFMIVIIVMGIMALSRCGASWSLDRSFSIALARGKSSGRSVVHSGEYTWPLRTIWLAMAYVFLAAGASKLRYSGAEWVTSDTLAYSLIINNYHAGSTNDPVTTWGLHLAQSRWLCRLLAASVMTLELLFPLALFSRKLRYIFLPASLLMLISIRLLLGPSFVLLMLCYVFWVPWDRIGRWLITQTSGSCDEQQAEGRAGVKGADVLSPSIT